VRSLGVAEPNPVADYPVCVLQRFELMSMRTLLLQRSNDPFTMPHCSGVCGVMNS
jgi:hypothetical protein